VKTATGADVAWTATADPGLRLAAPSGAPGEPLRISYDAAAQPLAAQTAALNVSVSAVVAGVTRTKDVPVAVDVAAHRIYAQRNGVALTSVPGVSALSARVRMVDNAGLTTGTWSAESDQAWLAIDGIEGDDVLLLAVPDGLAEGLHLATVTVSSSGGRVEAPERVRVGLYVSSAAPVQGLLVSGEGGLPVADPVRPWVWLVSAADASKAKAYNVYSGTLEAQLTLATPVARVLPSGDGATLYGGGMTQSGVMNYVISRVDVESGAALPSLTGDSNIIAAVLRPGGREFVATGGGRFVDTVSGTSVTSGFSSGWAWELDASADQRRVYGVSNAVSPASLEWATVGLAGATPRLTVADSGWTTLWDQVGVGRIAATPDGSGVWVPYGEGFRVFRLASGPSLEEAASYAPGGGAGFVTSVDVGVDGRGVVLAVTGLDCYDAGASPLPGARVATVALPSQQARNVALSGDGQRAIVTGATSAGVWVLPSR